MTLLSSTALLVGLLLLPAAPPAQAAFDHAHTLWNEDLGAHVHDGHVAYGEWSGDDASLKKYLEQLHAVTPAQFARFTPPQQQAFWINAYNAHVVRLILDNHPVSSIRSIGLLSNSAFRKSFIAIHASGAKEMTLQEVEAQLAPFKDPRLHFALTPAAAGAPWLRSTAYRADALDGQLEDAAWSFIRDAERNTVDAKAGTARLSELFRDHQAEFDALPGGLPGFLALYLEPGDAQLLRSKKALKIEFVAWDWALNGR